MPWHILRLIANPDDDNALLRVVNFPARGIGVRSLEQLQDDARRQGSSLWAAMLRNGDRNHQGSTIQRGRRSGFRQRAEKGGSRFCCADRMRCARHARTLPLPEIVEHMLEHSGLVAHYRAEREGADRLENLNELINAAASFVHEAEDDSLMAFLSHASLEAGEHQAGGGQDALQLMTVHSAKGAGIPQRFPERAGGRPVSA